MIQIPRLVIINNYKNKFLSLLLDPCAAGMKKVKMKAFSPALNMIWNIAVHEAAAVKSEYVENEHVFIGVFSLDKVVALPCDRLRISPADLADIQNEHAGLLKIVTGLNVRMPDIRHAVRPRFVPGGCNHAAGGVVHRSASCKERFKFAADNSASAKVTAMDILAAILELPGPIIASALEQIGITSAALKAALPLLSGQKPPSFPADNQALRNNPTPTLDVYGRDLTREAEKGNLGPFVGRRDELLQIIQTLARSKKNNPLIVGEAGVGKTAVVEALAVRGSRGKDPHVLGGRRIVELNLGALQGGTKYRGDFEERLNGIMKEVRENKQIIVFIDEIHNLMGAGSTGDNMDAANILKPALARGDFNCIGATTIAEYRRYIEKDPALARRFEMIVIKEPERDEAVAILKGIRPRWEKHYQATITDKAIEAAVDLSMRFITDRRLPDKAIDLVDRAGARARVPMLSMVAGAPAPEAEPVSGGTVSEQSIAQVLSEKTGVPLEIIAGHGRQNAGARILQLAPYLKRHIIGQDQAVDIITRRLKITFSGITRRTGPLGVFLFLGPTGVGKTEMAKIMAAFLFGSPEMMIRLDMSEFMEAHSVSKLIGSPPGYVGHGDEGQLTGKLRTTPYAVVLLDEVEKAHTRVFDLFLQVFDDGRLTDAKGRTIKADNAIFIMTSNLGLKTENQKNLGFVGYAGREESGDRPDISALTAFFRREFLNRIDEIIVFNSLSRDGVREIAVMMCQGLMSVLKNKHGVSLDLTDGALDLIVSKGFSPEFGARELKRAIDRLLQIPLSTLVLEGKLMTCKQWRVTAENDELVINPASP